MRRILEPTQRQSCASIWTLFRRNTWLQDLKTPLFVYGTLMIYKVSKLSAFIKAKSKRLDGIVKMIIHSFRLGTTTELMCLMCVTMKVTQGLRFHQWLAILRAQTGIQSWSTTSQCQLKMASFTATTQENWRTHCFNYRHTNKHVQMLFSRHISHRWWSRRALKASSKYGTLVKELNPKK